MSNFTTNREDGGRAVRTAWIQWAKTQENPKPSWLTSWEQLAESDKEADRCIWDAIAMPYITLINGLYAENARLLDTLYRMQAKGVMPESENVQ